MARLRAQSQSPDIPNPDDEDQEGGPGPISEPDVDIPPMSVADLGSTPPEIRSREGPRTRAPQAVTSARAAGPRPTPSVPRAPSPVAATPVNGPTGPTPPPVTIAAPAGAAPDSPQIFAPIPPPELLNILNPETPRLQIRSMDDPRMRAPSAPAGIRGPSMGGIQRGFLGRSEGLEGGGLGLAGIEGAGEPSTLLATLMKLLGEQNG